MRKPERQKNYSALEVANLCGVVNQTAINWIKKKYFKAFITPGGQYRVYGEDLAHFMKQRGMKIPSELDRYNQKDFKSLLLIEDEPTFAKYIFEEVLNEYPHYTFDRASNGFEAGILIAKKSYDLILIHDSMMGIKTKQFCEHVKSEKSPFEISIIVFSKTIEKKRKKDLLHAGADVYIKKPFDIGQISIYLE